MSAPRHEVRYHRRPRRCVGELGEELNIAASTVSHHIKELRQAGIIVVERRGKNIECWINEEAVAALRALLGSGGGACAEDTSVES